MKRRGFEVYEGWKDQKRHQMGGRKVGCCEDARGRNVNTGEDRMKKKRGVKLNRVS